MLTPFQKRSTADTSLSQQQPGKSTLSVGHDADHQNKATGTLCVKHVKNTATPEHSQMQLAVLQRVMHSWPVAKRIARDLSYSERLSLLDSLQNGPGTGDATRHLRRLIKAHCPEDAAERAIHAAIHTFSCNNPDRHPFPLLALKPREKTLIDAQLESFHTDVMAKLEQIFPRSNLSYMPDISKTDALSFWNNAKAWLQNAGHMHESPSYFLLRTAVDKNNLCAAIRILQGATWAKRNGDLDKGNFLDPDGQSLLQHRQFWKNPTPHWYELLVSVDLVAGIIVRNPEADKPSPLLRAACQYSCADAIEHHVRKLLEAGAHPSGFQQGVPREERKPTDPPPALALVCDRPAMGSSLPRAARVLLKAGADPNNAGSTGLRPLHGACQNAQDASLVQELLDAGADRNAPDRYGRAPLHVLLSHPCPASMDKLDILLSKPSAIDPNQLLTDRGQLASASDPVTPLLTAIKHAKIHELQKLVQHPDIELNLCSAAAPLSPMAYAINEFILDDGLRNSDSRMQIIELLMDKDAQIRTFSLDAAPSPGPIHHAGKGITHYINTVTAAAKDGHSAILAKMNAIELKLTYVHHYLSIRSCNRSSVGVKEGAKLDSSNRSGHPTHRSFRRKFKKTWTDAVSRFFRLIGADARIARRTTPGS